MHRPAKSRAEHRLDHPMRHAVEGPGHAVRGQLTKIHDLTPVSGFEHPAHRPAFHQQNLLLRVGGVWSRKGAPSGERAHIVFSRWKWFTCRNEGRDIEPFPIAGIEKQ